MERWLREHPALPLSPPGLEEDYEMYLARLKTALILNDWINEVDDNTILEKYELGPGDLYNLVQSAEWLAYATREVARVLGLVEHVHPLSILRERIKHGVKPELLQLTRIRGIGRKRARVLYSHGIRSIADLARISPHKLASLPLIGRELARRILEEAGVESEELVEEKKGEEEGGSGTLDDYIS